MQLIVKFYVQKTVFVGVEALYNLRHRRALLLLLF